MTNTTQKNEPRPRWWLLYLALPLAVLLFWLIDRAQPTESVRRVLEIGAVLITFGYIELWYVSNKIALLYDPMAERMGGALYYAREVTPGNQGLRDGRRPAPSYTFYSDFFAAPVRVGEAPPPTSLQILDEGSAVNALVEATLAEHTDE